MPDSTPPADADDPLPTGIPSARVQLRAALDMSLADGSPCVSVPLYLDEVRALLTALTDNDKLRERVRVLEEAFDGIRIYGSDTLSGRADGPDDRKWQRDAVLEMTRRAVRALKKEGKQP